MNDNNKLWAKNYSKGIPENIKINTQTFLDIYNETIIKYSNNIAVNCHEVNFTFKQIDVLANNFASYLQNELKISKGDRIAIVLPNCIQSLVSIFACIKIGAIFVNINPLYKSSELKEIYNSAEIKIVIVLDMFAKNTENIISEIPSLQSLIVTNIADTYNFPKKQIIGLISKYFVKTKPNFTKEKFIDFNKCIKKPKKIYTENISTVDDILCLQYSSGTTGKPKGVILTNNNIVSNLKQINTWINGQFDNELQIIITALPLYHIFSLMANLFVFFLKGHKNILIPNARDIDGLIKTMSKHDFTIFNGLNTLYVHMLDHPKFNTIANKKSYKTSLSGGMPINHKTYVEWLERTGCALKEGYGMTEMSPAISLNKFDDSENDYFGTSGYPIPSTEVSIRDIEDNSIELENGQEGEIWLDGPQKSPGYWKDDENNESTYSKDGWLKTGDIGYIDKKGRIVITDRIKNMIIVSGFNVYPREIENVITHMPNIKETAVIGINSESSGEKPLAFISLNNPNDKVNEKDIINYCKKHLANYKVPKKFIFVDSLPKNNTGKIALKKLKQEYLK